MTWSDDRAEAVDAAKRLADAVDALHAVGQCEATEHELVLLAADAAAIGHGLMRLAPPPYTEVTDDGK